MSKIVRMQYPLDKTGDKPLYDGQVHYISPRRLRELNIGRDQFYVMEYFDSSVNNNLITLLARNNNTLTKVPLDDYGVLFDFLDTHDLKEVKVDNVHFPYEIGVTNITNSYELFSRYKEAVAVAPPLPPTPPSIGGGPTPPNGPGGFFRNKQTPPVATGASEPPTPPNPPEEFLERKNVYLFTAVYVDDGGNAYEQTYELQLVLDRETLMEKYLLKRHHNDNQGEIVPLVDSKDIDLNNIYSVFGTDYKYCVKYKEPVISSYDYLDSDGSIKKVNVYVEPGEYVYQGVACGVRSKEVIDQMLQSTGLLITPNWEVIPKYPVPHIEFYNACNGTTPMYTMDIHGKTTEVVQPSAPSLK